MAVTHAFTSAIEDGADNTLVQPSDWNASHTLSNALGAIDALTPAASKIAYFTGAAAATLTDITATGISLLGVADAAAGRTALGLGTIATQAADSVSLTGGSISGMTSIGGTLLSLASSSGAEHIFCKTNDTSNSNQSCIFVLRHYTSASEESATAFRLVSESGVNQLYLGGGALDHNACTMIKFFTASNYTTKYGTERGRVTSAGRWLFGTTTDDGVNPVQVGGGVSLVGNLNIKNAGGSALVVNNYSGANSTGSNVWIGGGGASSIGESGATYKGSGNLAAGASALNSATTAYWNAAIGYTALYGITTGHSNTALGYAAGRFISGGSVLNTASTGSLYLGAATKAGADGNANELVIGFDTTGMGSNTAILGNSRITHTYLRGQVLIGTTTPQTSVAATINGIIALQSSSSLVGMITTGSTINTFRSSTILGFCSGGLDTDDEHLRLTSAGRVLAGPTLPTDNGVDALQVNGTIASTGYKLSALNTAPASASATGTLGEIRITADAIYICTATDTWKKVAIATW